MAMTPLPHPQNLVGDGDGDGKKGHEETFQHVLVMRHGDRIDNFEPLWVVNARRPWDPVLTDAGKVRAWSTGKRIRKEGFLIQRVFVSPFIRCLQTAAEVITALCAAEVTYLEGLTSEGVVIDPSKVKVSIEYGLCEVMSREARIEAPPSDGKWFVDVSEMEAIIPSGTIDRSVEPLYHEPPKWEESVADARNRYKDVMFALANKYPHENLLLITHGEGVGVSVVALRRDVVVYDVEYCAYSHGRRLVSDQQFGEFELVTKNASTGIGFLLQD